MTPPSPASAGDAPGETSPLLPAINNASNRDYSPIDPGAGLAPEGADPHWTDDARDTVGGNPDDGRDGLERQTSAVSVRRYEGMPDVQKRLKFIFPAVGIGVLLVAADQTIVVSSYGKIGSDLHALSTTSWIATAYFLTLTSFQPLYGKLSDIFGRKQCILFAYTVFGIGCLFCGLAQNMTQLILARAVAGIGGSGMTTVVSILFSDIVSLRDRGTWQGYLNIIFATGSATGAPLGGLLSDTIGWRWLFLAQVPLCLVAFAAVFVSLRLPPRDDSHWKQKLKRVDFLGASVLLAAVVCLVFGVDRGGNKSWTDKHTLAAVLASIPLFVLFSIVEGRVAQEPAAPARIIFSRSLFASYLCNFFSFAGWMPAIFFTPLYFQAVDDLTATQAGVRLIPAAISSVTGSLVAGVYMKRTGKYYWITVVCCTTLVAGMIIILLCSGVVVHSSAGLILGLCLAGFSNGICVTTSLIALISNATREDQAIATACSYLFRSLGSVLGVSLCATVANSALRTELAERLDDGPNVGKIADSVRQSLDYIRKLDPNTRIVVEDCYGSSIQAAFALCIAFEIGTAIFSWFLKEKQLVR